MAFPSQPPFALLCVYIYNLLSAQSVGVLFTSRAAMIIGSMWASRVSSDGFPPPLEKTPSLGALSYLGRDVTNPLAAAETRRGQGETPSAEGVGGGGGGDNPPAGGEGR